MAIRFSKYVDIVSRVGGVNQVQLRDYIARLFAENALVPTKTVLEFTSIDLVGDYFGTGSEEYKRASFYFSFISKNTTSPQLISFSRWTSADTEAMIFGSRLLISLSTLQLVTNGVFSLTIGTHTANIGPIDFSGAASFAAAAALIQTAVRADADPQFATANVTYDATRGGFNLVSGQTGIAAISVAAGTGGTDIHDTIGWGPDAIFSNGALAETITETLTNSADDSDNFGSFLFMPTLTLDEIEEAAQWNKDQNVKYIYSVVVTSTTDAQNYYNRLKDYAGTCLTYNVISGEYPEMLPMAIFASTNYSGNNVTQNYMFQQAILSASVSTNALSDQLDGLRVNYYGQTQSAGNQILFYQRGFLLGLPTDPLDINTYANEIWLKDAAGAAIINLFLALNKVSANLRGVSQILAVLQSVIDQAVNNGVISQDKKLTQTQKVFIAQVTDDPDAYFQVQTIGYWINCEVVPNGTEYKANYTLVYSKDDVIRFVQGSHILI